MAIEVKQMWASGPLRQWSATKPTEGGRFVSYDGGGYAGPYVCGQCQETAVGVYCADDRLWRCISCHVEHTGQKWEKFAA